MPDTDLQRICQPSYRATVFLAWLRDPFHVATVTPSGRFLGRMMAEGLQPGMRVLELGAGTGNMTQAILDTGVRASDLWLVEKDEVFVGILRRRFPQTQVLQVDATKVARHLSGLAGRADAVISGLPIAWFDREKKRSILVEAFSLLRPGGRFVQFTYLGRTPVGRRLLSELGLAASLQRVCPANLPPAFVYSFERR